MKTDQKREPYIRPLLCEQGKLNHLTQGDEGPKTEPGENIVWGTEGFMDPGPRPVE